jgi:hypothetical protein
MSRQRPAPAPAPEDKGQMGILAWIIAILFGLGM